MPGRWYIYDKKNQDDILKKFQKDTSWVQAYLKRLRTDLKKAGIIAYLDIMDNEYGSNIYTFMSKIKTCDYVLLIGSV
jgi:hypothetical protein